MARVPLSEWGLARRSLPAIDDLLRKAFLEAAEGKPIVRYCVYDGEKWLRSDMGDEYVSMIECEADG